MTRFDLHPEDLLERARRGQLGAADSARLDQHLSDCDVCRVERALSEQAALDAAPLRDEELIVARLKRDVASRLRTPAVQRSRRKSAWLLALAAAGLGSVAAAATIALVSQDPARASLDTAAAAPADQGRVAAPLAAVRSAPDWSSAPPPPAAPAPAAKPLPAEPATAAELFSRANQARRDGKTKEAARLYRALQERFSGSSEELVSRVTLGRLLLDRLGDSRGALVQFNSYLASPGGGALREEAMVGRALALGRMARAGEESAAWRALLEAFPKSAHAKRAHARVDELAGSDPAGAARAAAIGGSGSRAR